MENKTDLAKVLSISGQRGLFLYVAQARTGAIVESLANGKRVAFDINSKMTSLYDISIYTSDEDIRLQDVFIKMNDFLKGEKAPGSKSDVQEIKKFFEEVLPDYDRERFYVSHMKKVLDWYNELREFASLDFVIHEDSNS